MGLGHCDSACKSFIPKLWLAQGFIHQSRNLTSVQGTWENGLKELSMAVIMVTRMLILFMYSSKKTAWQISETNNLPYPPPLFTASCQAHAVALYQPCWWKYHPQDGGTMVPSDASDPNGVLWSRCYDQVRIDRSACQSSKVCTNREGKKKPSEWCFHGHSEIITRNWQTFMYSSASSGVNAPLSRNKSTKQTAMHPSTFSISYSAKKGHQLVQNSRKTHREKCERYPF